MSDMSERPDGPRPETAADWFASEMLPKIQSEVPTSPTPLAEELTFVARRRSRIGLLGSNLTIVLPVIGVCLVLALVLTFILLGRSNVSAFSNAGRAGPRVTELSGDFVNATASPFPVFMHLTQAGTTLTGSVTVPDVVPAATPRLVDRTDWLSGEVSGLAITLLLHRGSNQITWEGTVTKNAFEVRVGSTEIGFARGSLARYHGLLAHERAQILSSVTGAAGHSAESNLVNALTEAKDVYQATQSYSADGHPYGSQVFSNQAPEFTWMDGACTAVPSTCISVQVMDVSTVRDAQGVALAAYSAQTATCWYAIDLQVNPTVIPADLIAFEHAQGSPSPSASRAGTYFATSPAGRTESSCNAQLALGANQADWGVSPGRPGSLG